jgi:hypothetical protein
VCTTNGRLRAEAEQTGIQSFDKPISGRRGQKQQRSDKYTTNEVVIARRRDHEERQEGQLRKQDTGCDQSLFDLARGDRSIANVARVEVREADRKRGQHDEPEESYGAGVG